MADRAATERESTELSPASFTAPAPRRERTGIRAQRLSALRLRVRLPGRLGALPAERPLDRRAALPGVRVARWRPLQAGARRPLRRNARAGTEQLLDDLNMLARANMEDQIEGFSRALWADGSSPKTSSRPPPSVPRNHPMGGGSAAGRRPRRSARRPRRRRATAGRGARRRGRRRCSERFAAATRSRAPSRTSSSTPVAAIRSQTASAAVGVELAQVERAPGAGRARGRGSAAG